MSVISPFQYSILVVQSTDYTLPPPPHGIVRDSVAIGIIRRLISVCV